MWRKTCGSVEPMTTNEGEAWKRKISEAKKCERKNMFFEKESQKTKRKKRRERGESVNKGQKHKMR